VQVEEKRPFPFLPKFKDPSVGFFSFFLNLLVGPRCEHALFFFPNWQSSFHSCFSHQLWQRRHFPLFLGTCGSSSPPSSWGKREISLLYSLSSSWFKTSEWSSPPLFFGTLCHVTLRFLFPFCDITGRSRWNFFP